MNVYAVSNGQTYGLPLMYENDNALKEALSKMYGDLLDLDEDHQVADAVVKTKVYQIGRYNPQKGVLRGVRHRLAFDCSTLLEVTHV